MCGRTACTLAPDDICRACGYKTSDGKWRQPQWHDPPGGQKYYTSYNIAPGAHVPVLAAKKHFDDKVDAKKLSFEEAETCTEDAAAMIEEECIWIVQPMQWGLVPSWHSGSPKSVAYSMNNARSEGILTKNVFKRPLEKGRRCVVVVDGYFEWHKTSDGTKQPYFIYFPHADSDTVELLNKDVNDPETVYTGRRLLTMAGLFDVWRSKEGEAPLYSCSIITVESHKNIAWLHDRMPAILDGEQEVKDWLDYGAVPLSKALELIRPQSNIQWHPVSTIVNNSKNNTEQCIKPIDLKKEKQSQDGSSSFMKSWLRKGKKRLADLDDFKTTNEGSEPKNEDKPDSSPEKKIKTEC